MKDLKRDIVRIYNFYFKQTMKIKYKDLIEEMNLLYTNGNSIYDQRYDKAIKSCISIVKKRSGKKLSTD